MNILPLSDRTRLASLLVEGNSLRSTSRLANVHRSTITRFLCTLGDGCYRLHHGIVHNVRAHFVQLDEIWTFVHTKERRKKPDDPEEFGDQYTFVGIDANSKLVLSYLVGKRTAANAVAFAEDLRARILGAPQVSTDGFPAYRDALETAFGAEIHHGVAIKLYEDEGGEEHRYAPGRVTGVSKTRVSGEPNEAEISTSYVERQNLTMRQGIRRFTRLTNAFSKSVVCLQAAVALHFAYYNFCRVHMTLRVTPAMQSGLTRHVWTVEELVERALSAPMVEAPPPAVVVVRRAPVLRLIQGGR
jgi:IS1 family transposase